MAKEMIVSVNGREKKIAILDNGRVTEFYIERGEENSGVVGNVYKGKVMRVLPGMQSAFVDIGLERDAFLYVSDFFDEEEEIERIVADKSKKSSPEEAKREANEQIELSRVEREKQMESAQEIAEPLGSIHDTQAPTVEDVVEEKPAKKSRRGRGKKGAEPVEAAQEIEPIEIEFDNSGFERIADEDEDTGEMFKDAYIQEAIIDRVRAAEFEIEGTAEAAVGSLLADTEMSGGDFERIADEDEAPAPKKRTRKTKAEKEAEATDEATEEKAAPKKKPASKRASAKGKFAKPKTKKTAKSDALEDAEASHKESDEVSLMAVRRGGRGRRRGRAKTDEAAELNDEINDLVENDEIGTTQVVEFDAPEDVEVNGNVAEPAAEETAETGTETNESDRNQKREPRGRDRNRNRDRDRKNGDGRSDNRNDRGRGDRRDRGPQPLIADLLKEGQEILVQIAKEPIAKKGARITSHIALPGRYLVYMPTIEHLGVSRKIESSNERGRLRTLIQRIRQDKDITSGGFIVRTAGIGVSEEDLRNDAKYLAKMWAESKKGSEKKKSPALVHQDLDLVQRLLRDQLADDFSAIRIDSEEEYQRTVEFIHMIQPRLVNRIKLYTREQPILEYYGVQEEIDKALKPRVWLKSGGYLVINQTEALVAIDVNTGKFVGKGNARLEDTITRTNLEAVDEIARQIRLRDLGGIIVLDLIDMEDRRNRHKVADALKEALSSDKSPTKVLSFNDFGLIIMTRKRVKQSLERTMCAPCENCEGSGWVKSPTTVCYEILAEARRLAKSVDDVRHTALRVHPEVANTLRGSEREVLEEIEAHLGPIDIASDKHVHQGQFDFAFV
ncbi:MAG TPA: Rne/Rng family ribonuclease [Pyrinomonadaceae bacterium]|nr:Rne/Rng family ribonuclease [Pyrinomonadaceae bacterium]